MILELCWDGLWTLSSRLSQYHGHGSWLVCEVALSLSSITSFNLNNTTKGACDKVFDKSTTKVGNHFIDRFTIVMLNLEKSRGCYTIGQTQWGIIVTAISVDTNNDPMGNHLWAHLSSKVVDTLERWFPQCWTILELAWSLSTWSIFFHIQTMLWK